MTMEWPVLNTAVSIGVVIGMAVIGYYVKEVRDSITDLYASDKRIADEARTADKALSEKVAAVALLVAGNYVTREEFRDELKGFRDDMREGFDRIEERMK